MKKLVVLAGAMALASCAEPAETTAEATPAATTAETQAAAPAAWTGFEPGSYTVSAADGRKIDFVLTADTYTATMADGTTETGVLSIKDGKGCMRPQGETGMCWTNAPPGPDGSWVATNDAGETSTITRKPA